jgi:hypothetical protein
MPAKANSGRLSSIANHVQTFLPVTGSAASVGSQKLVTGTRQRNSGFIHARQCGELVLRMFVTPLSIAPGLRNAGGVGMPQRAATIALARSDAADNRGLFVGEDTGQAKLVPTAHLEKLAHRLVGGCHRI